MKIIVSTLLAVLLSAAAAVAGSFKDNGNGTITDLTTGLMWQKCTGGQNNDATCSGTATDTDWPVAIGSCEGLSLGGFSDWRLPNIKELNSIVDTAIFNPAINVTYFPNTTASWYYWSSTSNSTDTTQALLLYASDGGMYVIAKGISGPHVRCVRGQ